MYLLKELKACDIAKGIDDFYQTTLHSNHLVISGGDQIELIKLFKKRDLYKYFECGVFGSPDSKETIFKREILIKNIIKPALYIGDSRYDFQIAKQFSIDFIFVSDWSEFEDIKTFAKKNKIPIFKNIEDLFLNLCN